MPSSGCCRCTCRCCAFADQFALVLGQRSENASDHPQPLATFTEHAAGFSFAGAGIPGVGIVCEPRTLPFAELAERQGFDVWPITSGHDVMVIRPSEFTDLLLRALGSLDRQRVFTDR